MTHLLDTTALRGNRWEVSISKPFLRRGSKADGLEAYPPIFPVVRVHDLK